MKKIILISAKAHSGKDYCADYIAEQLKAKGYTVVRDMFAKYIKGYLRDYYGWDGITKDDFYRDTLQQMGTEDIKEDLNYKCFHAKRLCEDFNIVEKHFDFFIVSDTRFKDEIYIMKAMFPDKVLTIRINRIDIDVKEDLGELSQHKSELDLDDFDFDINIENDGTDYIKSELNLIIKLGIIGDN